MLTEEDIVLITVNIQLELWIHVNILLMERKFSVLNSIKQVWISKANRGRVRASYSEYSSQILHS